jgi:SAM-dependent methyltransferase
VTDNSFWERRYSVAAETNSTLWSLGPNAWIAETVETLFDLAATAVDLAAGEGRNALWLASLGWRVTAVDFSPAGLAIGRDRAIAEGLAVDWVEADATTWVAPTPVDLVVVAYLQLPAEALARAIDGAAASLTDDGVLALIGHDRDNLVRGTGGPQDADMLLTVGELRAAASAAGLSVERCEQFERHLEGGAIAIDAILVARKLPSPPPE